MSVSMTKTYDADRSNYIPKSVERHLVASASLREEGYEHFATNSRTGFVVRLPGTGWVEMTDAEAIALCASDREPYEPAIDREVTA